MKTELNKALSHGNFGQAQAQAQAVARRRQDANQVHQALNKSGSGERGRLADLYVKSAKDASSAEQSRLQSRLSETRKASQQFGKAVSKGTADVNKTMAALIAPPINGQQPAIEIGKLVDRLA